jgi:hypothetical protein
MNQNKNNGKIQQIWKCQEGECLHCSCKGHKVCKDVPPQVAEMVDAEVQQALTKFQTTPVDQHCGVNLAGGHSLADMTLLTYKT